MPKETPAADPPITQSTLLEAMKLLIAEMGESRASQLSATDLADALHKHDVRDRKINPDYPEISPFSYPEGNRARPKPTLTRETWLNHAKVDETQVTPFEVLALNALSQSLPAAGQERSSRGGKWRAKVSQDGRKLLIIVPCESVEDRAEANASSVGMLCQELAEGTAAVTPESMFARIDELEARLAQLTHATAG